jgi:bifunctional non-homologous end joining protein LigD
VSDPLETYRAKRDFGATPEPGGAVSQPIQDTAPQFVIQEHHARRLHWDLRLARDGVLKSWALPRGLPPDPGQNHLAVPTEDHPMEYLEFSGDIPTGQYGAGTMTIWDRGTYDTVKWSDREVMVDLHGQRGDARYVLFRTGDRQWMIHRMTPAEPGWERMPDRLEPMRATTADDLPLGDEWAYEIKWDGYRVIAFVARGSLRLQTRNLLDCTDEFPEVAGIARQVGAHDVILDGEVVALDAQGRPSFELLQARGKPGAGNKRRIAYMVFDVLWLDGQSTMPLPYHERRALLESLALKGAAWQTPARHVGDGAALLEATRAQGLEGLVAKRLNSIYEPGKRTRAWLKVKHVRQQELVIGGWLDGEGSRAGRFGALLAGYYDDDGLLRFAGRVGGGFTDAMLDELRARLDELATDVNPFTTPPALPPRPHFVRPELVAEAAFTEWTAEGLLRHPRFKGLRFDKDPRAVTRE